MIEAVLTGFPDLDPSVHENTKTRKKIRSELSQSYYSHKILPYFFVCLTDDHRS